MKKVNEIVVLVSSYQSTNSSSKFLVYLFLWRIRDSNQTFSDLEVVDMRI